MPWMKEDYAQSGYQIKSINCHLSPLNKNLKLPESPTQLGRAFSLHSPTAIICLFTLSVLVILGFVIC
ncbi:unnamed protein product [Lactuca virosa]|uniref:Uncharacterized protein n=1 Tax=Lactuca virosa TaxID=75947 RepID=A0AAU9MR18_9ASTR|nr:unnamed protein product [Lactuca virosa]